MELKTIVHPDEELNKLSELCLETLSEYKLCSLANKKYGLRFSTNKCLAFANLNKAYFKLQEGNPAIAQRFQEDFLDKRMSVTGRVLAKHAHSSDLEKIYNEIQDIVDSYWETEEGVYSDEIQRIFLLDNAGYFENLPETNEDKILRLKSFIKDHQDRCDEIELTMKFFNTLEDDVKDLLIKTIGFSSVSPRKVDYCLIGRLEMAFFLQLRDKGIIVQNEDSRTWIIPNLMLFVSRLLKRHYNNNKTITGDNVFYVLELLPLHEFGINRIRKLDECFYHRIKVLENK